MGLVAARCSPAPWSRCPPRGPWPLAGIAYWIAKYAVPYPDLPMVISGEPFTATAIVIMTGITGALITAGLAAVRRRPLS
ncbi:hypothetical protein SAMN05444920_109209 [Nonomuraea solani]|uniref:Uncharacterized protein n=1 Tax=Nonomuraea solani TaxID=1144553 RepID=A0A1H6EG42_9ACTN|nr:hypothetical protein SAMN05444920_109209 [Nonomuraea solani]